MSNPYPRSGRRARLTTLLLVILAIGLLGDGPRADERPLPDVAAFAAQVRARLQRDRDLQSQYTYLERREEISVSKLGKVKEGPVKVYEVYPSAEPGNTYKRLIEVDGVPVSREDLERGDRIHREDVLKALAKREQETPRDREKRLRKEAKERREVEETLDEIFEVYDIRLVGREMMGGHETVVATLHPRKGSRPRTDGGKFMKKVRARAWITEGDHQVVRVEMDVVDDVTFGFGIVGRLHKGTRGVFERTRVNDEVWLPARITFKGTGRLLLLRKFALDTVTVYSDYRKFTVGTNEVFGAR